MLSLFSHLRKSELIILLFVFSIIPSEKKLFASEPFLPFSTFATRVNGITDVNQSSLNDYWDPQYGAELIVDMPFYWGDIQGGIHFYTYEGKSESQPDFLNLYIYIGWGPGFRVFKNLYWFNGIQVGIFQMHFDDSDIHESQALESELAVGVNTRIDFQLSNNWSIQAGAAYLYVYTYKPLELLMVKAGFSYSFDTPPWLREFLK